MHVGETVYQIMNIGDIHTFYIILVFEEVQDKRLKVEFDIRFKSDLVERLFRFA